MPSLMHAFITFVFWYGLASASWSLSVHWRFCTPLFCCCRRNGEVFRLLKGWMGWIRPIQISKIGLEQQLVLTIKSEASLTICACFMQVSCRKLLRLQGNSIFYRRSHLQRGSPAERCWKSLFSGGRDDASHTDAGRFSVRPCPLMHLCIQHDWTRFNCFFHEQSDAGIQIVSACISISLGFCTIRHDFHWFSRFANCAKIFVLEIAWRLYMHKLQFLCDIFGVFDVLVVIATSIDVYVLTLRLV